jgi:hypothetical protein
MNMDMLLFLALIVIPLLIIFGVDASRKRRQYLNEQGNQ